MVPSNVNAAVDDVEPLLRNPGGKSAGKKGPGQSHPRIDAAEESHLEAPETLLEHLVGIVSPQQHHLQDDRQTELLQVGHIEQKLPVQEGGVQHLVFVGVVREVASKLDDAAQPIDGVVAPRQQAEHMVVITQTGTSIDA